MSYLQIYDGTAAYRSENQLEDFSAKHHRLIRMYQKLQVICGFCRVEEIETR